MWGTIPRRFPLRRLQLVRERNRERQRRAGRSSRADVQMSPQALGALAHAPKSVSCACRRWVEPAPVVADAQQESPVAGTEFEIGVGALRVTRQVVHCFL